MKQGQKNWEYSHVDQAWPIVHAFLPLDKEFNNTPMLKQKLSLIQDVESNNHLPVSYTHLTLPTILLV